MRQEQRRFVSQELILAEAIAEFGQYGYGEASLNRICDRGGISKGRLFHYFKDKDALFLACVQFCYDHLQQVQEFFQVTPGDGIEQTFHKYYQLRQKHFLQYPHEALMLRVASLAPPVHLIEQTNQIMERFVEATSRVLTNIMPAVQPPLPPSIFSEAVRVFHVASYYCHFRVRILGVLPEKEQHEEMEHELAFFDQLVHMMLYGLFTRDSTDQK